MASHPGTSFETRYAAHGPRYNVRDDYKQLPFQSLWTWITGKGLSLTEAELGKASRPLSTIRAAIHVVWSWIVIAGALLVGHYGLQPDSSIFTTVASTFFCWLTIVNRGRVLQATFHYMSHGSAMPNRKIAIWTACIAFTTPFLYTSWRAYVTSHVNEHHHVRVLCTEIDPDQLFIKANGFEPGMSERRFWLLVWLRPFAPAFIVDRIYETIRASIVDPSLMEVIFRLVFWSVVVGICAANSVTTSLIWLYVVPAFVLLNHSLWLQLLTEHLWFANRLSSSSNQLIEYGQLTWGRFQGRRPPHHGIGAWVVWWVRLVAYDLPVRLYVYPQDLPNHDFHHRLPVAPYHSIADIRATHEGHTSRFGPLLEVWGFIATLCVVRDHLCRCDKQPFRFFSTH